MKSEIHKIPSELNYVIIEDLPEDQREPFSEWMIGQTSPVIEYEEFKRQKMVWSAYAWDYMMWHNYWLKDEVAPKGQNDVDEISFMFPNEKLHDTGDQGPDGQTGLFMA